MHQIATSGGFHSWGVAEAHSMSFALLVYASVWFTRYYHPTAFCAGLSEHKSQADLHKQRGYGRDPDAQSIH
ncbi:MULTISPECIES: hypothetical protein [unclassified Amycolatopsis]|uniref:hypothetical protein n=1 Tax=unclassified Amycolatopsis TaxID=2618356 RepID=UPI001C6A61BA|nr:hypothetical protein [Amycolatopsis sp. DSM 110486]QYN18766.1 hypothetical protein K1T34_39565 [Amycolatopsis sp. DSM 110486]